MIINDPVGSCGEANSLNSLKGFGLRWAIESSRKGTRVAFPETVADLPDWTSPVGRNEEVFFLFLSR
jgi:hypothetical protein